MLSTRVIDGLTIHRQPAGRAREIEVTGGTEAEQSKMRTYLEIVLTAEPATQQFRDAYKTVETLAARAKISIGLTRTDETALRLKLEAATAASLDSVREHAHHKWGHQPFSTGRGTPTR